MNTKSHMITSIGLGLLFYTMLSVGSDEFQQWRQQQSYEVQAQINKFQEYKDKRDKEFTVFLKSHWKAVDLVKGEVRDKAPKPDSMPVAPVRHPVSVTQKPVVLTVPEPLAIKNPVVKPAVW